MYEELSKLSEKQSELISELKKKIECLERMLAAKDSKILGLEDTSRELEDETDSLRNEISDICSRD